MSEITLEKTHALLEKLAEYVMNEVPTKRDDNTRFAQIDSRLDKVDSRLDKVDSRLDKVDSRLDKVDSRFAQMEYRLERLELEKADKEDIQTILTILDKQAHQLEIIRTEQIAFDHAFMRLEKRVEVLECGDVIK